jgi:DNA-binding MarR family transcriptional regulator
LVSLLYYLTMPVNDSFSPFSAFQKAPPSSSRPASKSEPENDRESVRTGRRDDRWRETHLGRLLGHSMRRFDARVLSLMANNDQVPLALSNLAARDQISAAHIHITRHLSLEGSRLTELAQAAGMSKQAMGTLVDQCEAWGLVRRESDPLDARARQVVFTDTGLAWLAAFQMAVTQAEVEFQEAVGLEIATVVALGLEAYCMN